MFNWNKCLFLLHLVTSLYAANGFLVGQTSPTRHGVIICYGEKSNTDVTRRKALTQFVGFTATVATITSSSPANAKDEIFKKNPLTNSVLEQVCTQKQISCPVYFIIIGWVINSHTLCDCFTLDSYLGTSGSR